MQDSKIVIKIIEDQNGVHIDLDNLSIDASKSLQIILESFTKIAEEENNDNFSISIKKGSACLTLSAPEPELKIVHKKVKAVFEHNSVDETYINSLKAIQDVVKFKNFKYEITYSDSANNVNDLLTGFNQHKRFARKRRSPVKEQELKITFFKGKLMAIGGKYPNMHIVQGDESYTINCKEVEAKRVRELLYNNNVMISAWTKKDIDNKLTYTFCDHYVNEDLFNDLNNFAAENLSLNGTQPLKDIHNKLVDSIKLNDFGKVKKIIKLFKTESADVNRLRAILLSTKSFKSNNDIKELLISIVELIEKKTKNKII